MPAAAQAALPGKAALAENPRLVYIGWRASKSRA
jgi:hypothetical protein